jgi:hypothetical protein
LNEIAPPGQLRRYTVAALKTNGMMGDVRRLVEVVGIARDETGKWFQSGIVVARSGPR